MDFFAKKLLSAILLPVPIVVLALALAILFLIFNGHKHCHRLLVLGFIGLAAFSFSALPNWLLGNLESQYPTLNRLPNSVNALVVLGGGVRDNTSAPANTQLSSASLSRLVEAVRLYQQRPGTKIILSGGRVFGASSAAEVMDNLATTLGVKKEDVIIENGSRDTYHEAIYIKKILGNKPFALITSASHMPRAMALFQSHGLKPLAAPTQFLVKRHMYSPKDFLPNASNLVYADIAIHEYLGYWWAKWQGQIH